MALHIPRATATSIRAANRRNTMVAAWCITRRFTALAALAISTSCSSAIPPKPDFLMEFKNVGFCPGDDTRSRIQKQILSQVAAIKDPDVAAFLSGVTVEDNVADPVGMCPNGVCQCPAGSYRLGIWRNNLDATGAFVASSGDRKSALKDAPDLVPDQHAFSVLIAQRFLADLLAFKWNSLPKRWSRSGKPAVDGDIELLTANNEYEDDLTSVLTIKGTFHALGGQEFSIIVNDRLGKTNDTQKVTCATSKRVVDDTGVIGALLETFFPFPFWWAREVNNAESLSDLFGITDGYNKALAKLPAGLICTAAVTLPSAVPIPKNALGVADTLSFQYDQIRLGASGLFAAGQLGIAPREPKITVRDVSDSGILSAPFVAAPGNWYGVRVPADNFASSIVKFSAKAFVEDMRDPTVTWTLLAAWGPVSITATGESQKFQFQIPASVQPGDVGYGVLWVKAVDADGLVVSTELPLKIRVDDCCNTDMFNALFNQFCAAKVGLQRERCPLPVIDPD